MENFLNAVIPLCFPVDQNPKKHQCLVKIVIDELMRSNFDSPRQKQKSLAFMCIKKLIYSTMQNKIRNKSTGLIWFQLLFGKKLEICKTCLLRCDNDFLRDSLFPDPALRIEERIARRRNEPSTYLRDDPQLMRALLEQNVGRVLNLLVRIRITDELFVVKLFDLTVLRTKHEEDLFALPRVFTEMMFRHRASRVVLSINLENDNENETWRAEKLAHFTDNFLPSITPDPQIYQAGIPFRTENYRKIMFCLTPPPITCLKTPRANVYGPFQFGPVGGTPRRTARPGVAFLMPRVEFYNSFNHPNRNPL